jgi:tRNA pseudouridine38-40 synthase
VEGDILELLVGKKVIRDPAEARFQVASRTDTGVHALGNVMAFNAEIPAGGVLAILNSGAEDMWAFGAAEVADDFGPRSSAGSRWYRYYLPIGDHDPGKLRERLELFTGKHDFRSFSKKDDPVKSHEREIRRIDVTTIGEFLALDFEADSFLWNMVRRMVAAARDHGPGQIQRALDGEKLDLGIADPDGLILMDVDCGIDFDIESEMRSTVVRKIEKMLVGTILRQNLFRDLLGIHLLPGKNE